ncbi:uncharacterized protein LOC106069920 isoform X1 [Biomphalaria glabrata]|uniref:Uncharacterized protein LOC106069920 isoform X1 n=1 Tax=Biomphalaria glabrata TaxID=6526 RepID=A0A9W2Z3R2_BIOGL|nr:uncharacterized protein LOC106069920 isoform X1 [Biomphalaria glabrata]XP_055869699.1 uncharacterized protein LOC106069920 isoform X1 [Biomphalaria glabrata]
MSVYFLFLYLVALATSQVIEDEERELSLRDDDNISLENNMDADDVFELVQKVVSRSMGVGVRASDLVRFAGHVRHHADRFSRRVSAAEVQREINSGAETIGQQAAVRTLFAQTQAARLNVALKLWGALADKGDLLEEQRRPFQAVLAAVSRTAAVITSIARRYGTRMIYNDGPL